MTFRCLHFVALLLSAPSAFPSSLMRSQSTSTALRLLIVAFILGASLPSTHAWISSTPVNFLRASRASLAWIDAGNGSKPLFFESGRVTGAMASNLAVYKNDGNFRFTDVSDILPVPSIRPFFDGKAVTGDFGNDGTLELFWTGFVPIDNRVSCGFIRWINSTAVIDAALELPCAPTCCIQRGEVIVADFDDNGSLDLFIGGVTDSGSYSSVVLSYNGTSFVDSTPLFFPLGLISGDFLNAAWNERDNSLFVQALDTATSTIVGAYYTFDESTSSFVDNTLSFTSFLYGGCLQWSDLRNDSSSELLQCGSSSNGTSCMLWEVDSSNSFTGSSMQFLPALPSLSQCSIAIADYNLDGSLDVLLCGATQYAPLAAAPVCRLYRQLSNNSFEQDLTFNPPGLSSASVSFSTLDNDCLPDIVISGQDSNGNPRIDVYRNPLDISLCVVAPVCPLGYHGLHCNCTASPPIPFASCTAGEEAWFVPRGIYNTIALGNTTLELSKPLIVNANFSASNYTTIKFLSASIRNVPYISIVGQYNCFQFAGNASIEFGPVVPSLGIFNATLVVANCTRGAWIAINTNEHDEKGCRVLSVKNTNYRGSVNGTKAMYTQVVSSECNTGLKLAHLNAIFIALGFSILFGLLSFIAWLLHQRKTTQIFRMWFAPMIYESTHSSGAGLPSSS